MKINTRKFGSIDIDETKTLTMPEGLPGFPGFERFVLLEDAKSAPFCWLQSTEEANLALVLMNPLVFKPDYEIDLKGFMASRGWEKNKEEDLLVYVVINIAENDSGKKITANLMGPVIINTKNNEAVQAVITDSAYSHQYNVLKTA